MRTWTKTVTSVAVILLLQSCITTHNSSPIEFYENSDEGIILVSITQDRGSVKDRANSKFTYSALGAKFGKSLSSRGNKLSLDGQFYDDSTGNIYTLKLPAGLYQFTTWSIDNGTGATFYPRSTVLDDMTFKVEPGKIVYLGNLHMKISKGKNVFGIPIVTGGHPEIRNKYKRDMSVFRSTHPELVNFEVQQTLLTGMLSKTTNKKIIQPAPVIPVK